jgi:uncharacterized protein YggE
LPRAFAAATPYIAAFAVFAICVSGLPERALAEAAGPTGSDPSVIRVHARATATAPPDQVEIDFSVITEAKRADVAAEENAKKQKAVLAAVKAQLGAGGRVETLGYGLTPKYVFPQNGVRRIVGYTASNTVHVTSGQLDRAGSLIDAGIGAGANQVQSLRFTLSEPATLRREALMRAAREARQKAEALAAALGMKLVRILRVEEDGASMPPRAPQGQFMARAEAAVTTPVEAADVELDAGITLTAEVAEK